MLAAQLFLRLLVFGLCLATLGGVAQAKSAVFVDITGLFDDPSLEPDTYPPIAVSGDGSTVFLQLWSTDESQHYAFRWRPGELPEELFTDDDAPSGVFNLDGITGVADDGSSFVTHWGVDLPNSVSEPVRWSEATGPVGLGSLSAGYYLTPWTLATSLSGDGETVIGTTNDPPGYSGDFTWTPGGGLQPRDDGKRSLNYDGSIAVGTHNGRASLFVGDTIQPIGPDESYGERITSNGEYAVVRTGDYSSGSVRRYYLWSEEEGLFEFPSVPGSDHFDPTDLSEDGNTAIGRCDEVDSCIWRRGVGTMTIEDYFRNELGLADELMDYSSLRPWSISADGSVIVGVADGAGYSDVAWAVLIVPEPSTSLLLAIALVAASRPRGC